MSGPPAVVVHGLDDARVALSAGLPVTLLSAPGAALSMGCLWWRELIKAARACHPDARIDDILDCAASPGRAMAALRIGQTAIVLTPKVPAYAAVCAVAAGLGVRVLAARPPALDLGNPAAARELAIWLGGAGLGE